MKDVRKFTLTLFLICAIAAGLLAFVNMLTKPKILAQAKTEEGLALKDVMSGVVSFQEIKKDGECDYFKALDKDKKIIGYCFLAKKHGYSSDIVTMVGINSGGEITGIKILDQNETPGLGARIVEVRQGEKTPWFGAQFKSQNVSDLKVDTITGATISSKAVIDSIKEKAKSVLGQIKNAE